MEGHKDDSRYGKAQSKGTQNHIVDKLQNTHTDQGNNHNHVKAPSLKQEHNMVKIC